MRCRRTYVLNIYTKLTNFLNPSYFIQQAVFNPSTHPLTGEKDWPSIVKSNDLDLKLKEIV